MPEIIPIRSVDDPRDVVHDAVARLVRGEVVVFPTETAYVAAAHVLQPQAVQQVLLNPERPGIIALKSPREAWDYLRTSDPIVQRLVRRCWPGPITLEFPVRNTHGTLCEAWPASVREQLFRSGLMALRVPAYELLREVLRLLSAPVVLSWDPANEVPVTQDMLPPELLSVASLVVDDGPCRYGVSATVVRIEDSQWRVTQRGVVTERTINRLANRMIVFVCTGNTCRSPMAEALFRQQLSQALGCAEDELVDRGFVIASAGLAAVLGGRPSEHAVTVLSGKNVDLSGHASQPLTERLIQQADHIFTMTRGHRDAILGEFPEIAPKVQLLSRSGKDISDPIGGDITEYQFCADEIEQNLRAIMKELSLTPPVQK